MYTYRSADETNSALKVLVVGDTHDLERCGQVLSGLLAAGYGFRVLGWMDTADDGPLSSGSGQREPVEEQIRDALSRTGIPDVVLLATDNWALRKRIVEIVPATTSILDRFALEVVARFRATDSTGSPDVRDTERIKDLKEVLMSGPETSIMVVDEDFSVLEIGNYLVTLSGRTREECTSRSCYRILRKLEEPCERHGRRCVAAESFRTGRSAHTLQEEISPDGAIRFFTVSGYPMKPTLGGRHRALVVWKDVTRGVAPVLSRHAQDLKENFAQVLRQDKMVALGKLASAAVHEINNPLQGILTFAKLIRDSLNKEALTTGDLERFRAYLDLIASESGRCGKILQGLLSFSRLSDLRKSPIDLSQLLDEVILLVGHRMTLQGVMLQLDVPGNLPLFFGDANRIKQALLNLMVNAMDAMPVGGTMTVSARRIEESRSLALKISDTGVGIPAGNQNRLFEPFFTTKEEGKGVGLGLSVVYGIVTQHGGTIEVASKEGHGTSVIVTLPLGEAEGTGVAQPHKA